jgi:hypothetical protein
MALGSAPAFTQGSSRVALATVGNAAPATASDQVSLEEQARQEAIQKLARAMLKKSLAEQAAAMKSAAPPQENVPVATTGAQASAVLADKAETTAAATPPAPAQVSPSQAPATQVAIAPTPAPQIAAVIPTPPANEQTASLDPQDMERLAGKAAEAIRNGDIASARLVLEHAVRAGDATALYALAETYDPRVLTKLKVQGMQGEPDTARSLYQRALDKGVEEARGRL